MTRKQFFIALLSLVLLLSVCFAVGTCLAAEQMYQVSETQLTKLESNNYQLQVNNKEQLTQLAMLKAQVAILRQELSSSRRQLETAQESLKATDVYLQTLEKQASKLSVSRITPVIAYGNKSGFMAGLRLRTSPHYDISLVGNSKAFVMSAAYSF